MTAPTSWLALADGVLALVVLTATVWVSAALP
jgi:hypothetical protein